MSHYRAKSERRNNGRPGGSGRAGASSNQPTNWSLKKSTNGQGWQPREKHGILSSEASTTSVTATDVQNLSDGQVPSHGLPTESMQTANLPVDVTSGKTTIVRPNSPSSQSLAGPSGSVAPSTPEKGNDTKPFIQFGSLSPSVVNGLQIPARTTSAPPNLDKPKQGEVRQETCKASPTFPTISDPKQEPQLPRKDVSVEQSTTGDSHPPVQTEKDIPSQSSNNGVLSPSKPANRPIPSISTAMPYPQPPVPIQFGFPGLQQVPMRLPIGNVPQVPQQMFAHNFPPRPLQPQAMAYQEQGFAFTRQMTHQLPPQFGCPAIGMPNQQFAQQHPGCASGSRKATVKITHPETHKELKLDKKTDTEGPSPGQRPAPGAISQQMPSFGPPCYFPQFQPNPYPFPTNSQAPRFNYPVGQSAQAFSIMKPPVMNYMPDGQYVRPRGFSGTGNLGPPVSLSSPHIQNESDTVAIPFIPKVEEHKVVSIMTESPKVLEKVLELPLEANNIQQPNISEIPVGGSHQQSQTDPVLPMSGQLSATVTSVVSSQKEQPGILSAPATTLVDSRADVAVTDGRKKGKKSKKGRNKKSSKKDPAPSQHQQIDELASEADRNLSTVNISKKGSNKDIMPRQLTENLNTSEDSSGVAKSSGTAAKVSMSSHGADVSNSVEAKTGETAEKAVSSGTASSGFTVKKKVPNVPIRSDSVELATKGEISKEDTGPLETPINSDLKTNKSIANDIRQTAHPSLKVDPTKEILREIKHGKPEVCNSSKVDRGKARVHPVPSAAVSSGSSNPVSSVPRENKGDISSEELIVHDSQEHQKQQLDNVAELKDRNIRAFQVSNTKVVCIEDVGSSSSTASYSKISSAEITLQSTDKLDKDVTRMPSERPTHSNFAMDKTISDSRRTKPTKGKKKRREILSKADAAGTSDQYSAYKQKSPEEEHRLVTSGDYYVREDGKNIRAEVSNEAVDAGAEKLGKAEPDDWESTANSTSPEQDHGNLDNVGSKYHGSFKHESNGTKKFKHEPNGTKKYTRDFLLTFSDKCTSLPLGFENNPHAAALKSVPLVISPHANNKDSSPGPSGGNHRRINTMDDSKWNKGYPTSNPPNPRLVSVYVATHDNRPGPSVNRGVLTNARGPSPKNSFGGIFSDAVQSLTPQGGVVRNSSDVDRWRSGNSRGLMVSPQTPMQLMHKAQNRYVRCEVSDEEEKKQRKLKAILNKLTPQNFEKLFQQVKEVKIDNALTLAGVISQIYDKALMEPTFCEMYANFCFHLSSELPDFIEDNEKITFRRLLLNKCQEEYERGEREQAEANRVEEEGEIKQSEAEREEKRIKARRRMLGNIRLIGELFKKKMLTERIIHECIKELLGEYENPDEENLEALCKLMSTIGETIDHNRAKAFMDAYFDRMLMLSQNQKLSSRVRFMLQDSIDLREHKWQQRRKVEGPKKIEEVHRDAVQERQTQAGNLARGPSINTTTRRGQSAAYGPRLSNKLPSPSSGVGGMHGSGQVRGYQMQDIRVDERRPIENRMLSAPLLRNPTNVNSIIHGPQGGVTRGMSLRGHAIISTIPLSQPPLIGANYSSPISHNSSADRTPYSTRSPSGYVDRFTSSTVHSERPSISASGAKPSSQDVQKEKSISASGAKPLSQDDVQEKPISASDAKPLSQDVLHDKSISAIREFYSAKDENEIVVCIKELNSPSFYPSMVSLWVNDSFERKDKERDLLAKLLVNLRNSQDILLTQTQLVQGFGSVLSSLEDTMTDAPRAAEFLGRIFSKLISDSVITLTEVGNLIREGGEEPGQLVKAGLASDVLGSVFENIKLEKGDSFLQETRVRANLNLSEFLPPSSVRARKLDAFL